MEPIFVLDSTKRYWEIPLCHPTQSLPTPKPPVQANGSGPEEPMIGRARRWMIHRQGQETGKKPKAAEDQEEICKGAEMRVQDW